MIKNGYPDKFPLLRSIRLNLSNFINNKKYTNCSVALNNIKCLSLDRDTTNFSEVADFMSMKSINFDKISTLTLRNSYTEHISMFNSESYKSLKLKELIVYRPNIDSLSQLMQQNKQLERVYMDLK